MLILVVLLDTHAHARLLKMTAPPCWIYNIKETRDK